MKAIGSRLGRSIGSRAIDRPNIGKDRRKLGTGRIDIPTGGVRGSKKPTGSRLDIDGDGWADEGSTNPVWVGLSNAMKPSKGKPKTRLSSGKDDDSAFFLKATMDKDHSAFFEGKNNGRDVSRHVSREQQKFQKGNLKELEARRRHEAIADKWIENGDGWVTYEWTPADKYKSPDYLRGRELGLNQSRDRWKGDSSRRRPGGFDEKAKASTDYNTWYQSYVRANGASLDNLSGPEDDPMRQ